MYGNIKFILSVDQHISKSLIIHKIKTKKISTVLVVWISEEEIT